jgi:hypothetical protein
MTLYCVKLAADGRYIGTLGVINESPAGYRFLPRVFGHTSSRKHWPTAAACIPRWAKKQGGRTITQAEFDALT